MARAGCTVQETENDVGACCLANEERCHGWGSGSLDLECERNKASRECRGESGFADEEWFACWCLGSMARSGCTLHVTERDLGACPLADEERCHGRGSGSLDVECERNEASSECLGESDDADEEWGACWCLGSMVRAGCTVHETERHVGACSSADDKRCHGWGSGSLDLKCERNEASSESLGESVAENAERSLGFDFRELEGSHHRGEADEEEGFEGGAENAERSLVFDFREVEGEADEEECFEGGSLHVI